MSLIALAPLRLRPRRCRYTCQNQQAERYAPAPHSPHESLPPSHSVAAPAFAVLRHLKMFGGSEEVLIQVMANEDTEN
jgi:hypothetical protein